RRARLADRRRAGRQRPHRSARAAARARRVPHDPLLDPDHRDDDPAPAGAAGLARAVPARAAPAAHARRGRRLVSDLLVLERVTVRFGGLTAVSALDLRVAERELVALIGPNGAGKTTAFNVVTGVYAPSAGRVVFAGAEIGGWRPSRICRRGIARTFQNIRLFRGLTVLENVQAALSGAQRSGLRDVLRGPTWRRREEEHAAE